MAIFALVRVSDEHKQSSDTQVHAIKTYCKKNNLKIDKLSFKSDFNWNFELIRHLIESRTMKGYLKIDLIITDEER